MKLRLAAFLSALTLLSGNLLPAQTGVVTWTNSGGGLWRVEANWNPHVPQTNDDYVFITNANTKTVLLDASTLATNRVVKTFLLSAPAGSTNTLRVEGAGPNDLLLEGQNDFDVGNRAAFVVADARVQVLEKVNGLFRVASGSVAITNGTLDLVFDVRGRIGAGGNGTLTLAGGALNAGTNFTVGYGNGDLGTMHLLEGTVDIQGQLRVGENDGSHGELLVTGGSLQATNAALSAAARIGNSGFGLLAVSNGIVSLDDTSVGRNNGATGIVHVAGGRLNASTFSLGRFAGAFGRLLVSGGELIQPEGSLWVGRESAGQLVISNGTVVAKALNVGTSPDGLATPQGDVSLAGGTLSVLSNVLIGTAGSSVGSVALDGGTLDVQPGTGPGEIQIHRGMLTLNSGVVQTAGLTLTSPEGQLQFNGGTLRARDLTAANGTAFVVGDGVRPAVLQMEGGTFSFADGLVINPNATLIVCGQLIGNVTQFGTIITNCPPRILNLTRSGQNVSVDFAGMSGLSYLLEFKTPLTAGNWIPVPPAIPGGFGTLTASDPLATNATRFYRIRVQ